MIDDRFKKIIRSSRGCAIVIAGSDSDKSHIDRVVSSLRTYGIPHQVRICSAHKQPDRLQEIIEEYNHVGGSVAYVAIASETDGLSGALSYHAFGPVISCPPDHLNLSCLNNPKGSSNAYIADPDNVGRFIAQIYSWINPNYREKLMGEKETKLISLEEADVRFRENYAEER